MMSLQFLKAFDDLFGHEGGYVFDPRDPGGETKYGISKRSYPHVDIKNLTVWQAQEIYYKDYWMRAKCNELPSGIAFDLFDAAANSGVVQAVRWLQRAVGTTADGIIGPITLGAVRAQPEGSIQARMSGHRLAFMSDTAIWPTFGRGWARRIASNLMNVGN